MAAVVWASPRLGRPLRGIFPRAWASFRGWAVLQPGYSRPPTPEPVMMVLALELAERGMVLEGMAVALAFYAYLRPGELLRLRGFQLVLPLDWSPQTGHWLTILVDPVELGRPGKTGEFDHSVSLDQPCHQWLARLLALHRACLGARDLVWPFSQDELRDRYRAVGEALLGKVHAPVLYQLRHGGASQDAFCQVRPLGAIQQRGNWKAPSSVRRYEKHGRVNAELRRLPRAAQALLARRRPGAEQRFAALFARLCRPRQANAGSS